MSRVDGSRWNRCTNPSALLLSRRTQILTAAGSELHFQHYLWRRRQVMAGCCRGLGRLNLYAPERNTATTMCRLTRELRTMNVHSASAAAAHPYCRPSPACNCVTTSFKSEPAPSLLLCDSCQRFYCSASSSSSHWCGAANRFTGFSPLQDEAVLGTHVLAPLRKVTQTLAAEAKTLSYGQHARGSFH